MQSKFFDRDIIINAVQSAFIELYNNDAHLIEHNVNERTITARFASYLEFSEKFESYNIDCEYNRNGDKPKVCGNLSTYPDIIIHHRGKNDNNLLVIEAKKQNSRETIDHDMKKIICFMEDDTYKYEFGCFLLFGKDIESSRFEMFYKADGNITKHLVKF